MFEPLCYFIILIAHYSFLFFLNICLCLHCLTLIIILYMSYKSTCVLLCRIVPVFYSKGQTLFVNVSTISLVGHLMNYVKRSAL